MQSEKRVDPSQALTAPEKPEEWSPNYTTLDLVLTTQLQEDFNAQNIPEKRAEEFKQRKIPLYLDAIRRGFGIVQSNLLERGYEFEVMDGVAKRVYTMKDGQIQWALTPTSGDLFARVRFYKQLQAEEIPKEGTTTFSQDPFLTEEMLKQGFKEQSRAYERFTTAVNTMSRLSGVMKNPQAYIPSYEPFLDDALEVYQKVKTKAESDPLFPLKDLVLEGLQKGEISLRIFDQAAQIAQDGYKLHTFFPSENSLEDILRDRPEHERTFIVELFTNPAFLTHVAAARNPVTEYKRIIGFNNFVAGMLNEFTDDPRNGKVALAHAISLVIQKQTPFFIAICKEMGVSEEIGLEYFRHMIAQRISFDTVHHQEFMAIAQEPNTDSRASYNHHYTIGNRVYSKGVEKSSPGKYKGNASPFDVREYFKNVANKSSFPSKNSLEKLSPGHKQEALDYIFRQAEGEGYFIRVFETLLGRCNILYSAYAKKFYIPQPKNRPPIRYTEKSIEALTLKKLTNLVENNNPYIIPVLEKIAVKAAILKKADEAGWVTDDRYIERAIGKSLAYSRRTTREQDLQTVLNLCVGLALPQVTHQLPAKPTLQGIVDVVAWKVFTDIDRINTSRRDTMEFRERTERHPQATTPIPMLPYDDFRKAILAETQKQYIEIGDEHFGPDYGKDKKAYYIDMIQASAEGLLIAT